MKLKLYSCATLILLNALGLSIMAQSHSKRIIVEAEVVQVGDPPTGVSGARRHVYQLVKYKVVKVIRGSYHDDFIVVDYLILTKNQLNAHKVGSLFVLDLLRRGAVPPIPVAAGIREDDVGIRAFYIPNKPPRIK